MRATNVSPVTSHIDYAETPVSPYAPAPEPADEPEDDDTAGKICTLDTPDEVVVVVE